MYNVRYTDHESNIASSCIMSDTQITSPSVSDIIHDDAMLDSWSVYLTLYMMTQCWTRDLCIWHYTWWRNVGLVICIWHYTWWRNVGLVTYVSDIIQNDVGLVICVSDIYRMMPCWTHDLCIWHYTEWLHVGLVICVSEILQNDAMLDSWSVYLIFYRMTPCWTHDLCIWHCTEWCHVGLVICVSDILQDDAMLDSWSVSDIIHDDAMLDSWPMYLTLYRMMLDLWSVYLTFTEWHHVGLVIFIILYNVRYTDHKSNVDPFFIMSDTQITSPTWSHSV